MKRFFKIFLIVLVLCPLISFSAGEGPSSGAGQAGQKTGLIVCNGVDCTTWKQLIDSIENLIKFIFKLAVVAATLSIAWAGFKYLTANGDMGKVKEAHKIFLMVLKGFLIMLVAYILVRFILITLVDKDFILLE